MVVCTVQVHRRLFKKNHLAKMCLQQPQPRYYNDLFLECVENFGGYPMNLRTDCGTENVLIAAIQHLTGGRHKYGTSPGNQRIEAWWSFYRRHHSVYLGLTCLKH